VIAADHPDRPVVLEDATRLGEPAAGEIVVAGEAVEMVPGVVDRVDPAAFGAEQVAAELQILRRVGKDHVDRSVGKPRHGGDTVALDDAVEREQFQVGFRAGT
jgi:hypothetical protein